MIVLQNMGGIAPVLTPATLPDAMAQTASNLVLYKGGVCPLKDTTTVATPTKSGVKKTIYRFGLDQPETQYWFSWTTDVRVVKGPIASDTTQRTYFTGDGAPKKTDMTLALTGGTSYPMAAYNLGVPAPTAVPTLTQVPGTGPTTQESRAYVYTNVTAWGEESGPSPAAIGTADASHVVKLSNFEAVPTGSYNIAKRYIYRTVTSSSGTNYYWVGEVEASATEFIDNTPVTGIGEVLMTLDWDTPPDDLSGLIALPSGALCGYSPSLKAVCFSVPNFPYAWPAKYRLTTDYEPVAVASMGQGVAVLTTGYPYFINTGDPESASMIRIEEEAPCVSSRSVVSVHGSVMYASPSGLVALSQQGADVVTKKMFDREAWQAINPTSLFAVKWDNKYVAFGQSGGFVLDLDGNFTTHSVTASAAYVEPTNDNLYLAIGTQIKKWNSGSALSAAWKSKRFELPVPTNFSCFQVKAVSYGDLTFNMYVDGLLTYSVKVPSASPMRLPSGFLKRNYEFEVMGADQWYVCAIANSITELKGI